MILGKFGNSLAVAEVCDLPSAVWLRIVVLIAGDRQKLQLVTVQIPITTAMKGMLLAPVMYSVCLIEHTVLCSYHVVLPTYQDNRLTCVHCVTKNVFVSWKQKLMLLGRCTLLQT